LFSIDFNLSCNYFTNHIWVFASKYAKNKAFISLLEIVFELLLLTSLKLPWIKPSVKRCGEYIYNSTRLAGDSGGVNI